MHRVIVIRMRGKGVGTSVIRDIIVMIVIKGLLAYVLAKAVVFNHLALFITNVALLKGNH